MGLDDDRVTPRGVSNPVEVPTGVDVELPPTILQVSVPVPVPTRPG